MDPDQIRMLQQSGMAEEMRRRLSDPRQRAQLEQQFRLAKEMFERYGPLIENYSGLARDIQQNPGLQTALRNAMANQDTANRVLQNGLLSANRFLTSPGFQRHAEALRRAQEMVESRVSVTHFGLLERSAISELRSPELFRPAVERIGRGEADQVLDEAAELATSDEIRETIERADTESLVSAAGDPEQDEEKARQKTDLEIDLEVELEGTGWSKEQLSVLRVEGAQILRILSVALHAAIAISSPAFTIMQIQSAMAGIITLLEFIGAAEREKESPPRDDEGIGAN